MVTTDKQGVMFPRAAKGLLAGTTLLLVTTVLCFEPMWPSSMAAHHLGQRQLHVPAVAQTQRFKLLDRSRQGGPTVAATMPCTICACPPEATSPITTAEADAEEQKRSRHSNGSRRRSLDPFSRLVLKRRRRRTTGAKRLCATLHRIAAYPLTSLTKAAAPSMTSSPPSKRTMMKPANCRCCGGGGEGGVHGDKIRQSPPAIFSIKCVRGQLRGIFAPSIRVLVAARRRLPL